MVKCPKCGNEDVMIVSYRGGKFIRCNCGFDETKQVEEEFGEKKSQKAKGSHSPYRAGGGKRTKQ